LALNVSHDVVRRASMLKLKGGQHTMEAQARTHDHRFTGNTLKGKTELT
jgi:hypothetical protein